MMPTKSNFKGRWNDIYCVICGKEETDQHLFGCPGFKDLIKHIKYEMFFDENIEMGDLKEAARCILSVISRLELLHEL